MFSMSFVGPRSGQHGVFYRNFKIFAKVAGSPGRLLYNCWRSTDRGRRFQMVNFSLNTVRSSMNYGWASFVIGGFMKIRNFMENSGNFMEHRPVLRACCAHAACQVCRWRGPALRVIPRSHLVDASPRATSHPRYRDINKRGENETA